MHNIIFHINLRLKLLRLNYPFGILLIFYPMAWTLAYYQSEKYLIVMMLSVLARTSGCLINDILDRKVDAKVLRTKMRPLADNSISLIEAFCWLFLISFTCFGIILFLAIHTLKVCILIGFMILVYPLMKRITYFPQVWLGLVFSMGVIFIVNFLNQAYDYRVLLLFLLSTTWVVGFDIAYAMQDLNCDLKVGIKSIPTFYQNSSKNIILILNFLTLLIFTLIQTTLFGKLFVLLLLFDFIYQYRLLKKEYFKRIFESNIRTGFIIYIGLLF